MQVLLQKVSECTERLGLSDIHVHAGCPIYLRVNGQMALLSEDCAAADDVWAFAEHFMTSELKQRWLNEKSLDLGVEHDGCRYRANFYFESGQPAVALRKIEKRAPTLEELGMPPSVGPALAARHGLVLLTGATGAGKSTSLAAMVNHVLSTRAVHLLTIEDPVEFRFHSRRSLVSQREIGVDAVCFKSALRAAFREDPDLILIGEMRDVETISLALSAAETGHLVLATLHTSSCAGAVGRIVDAFPSGARDQVRTQLADGLQMVVNQRLLSRADGNGRVAAFEVLLANNAVRNLIRENKVHQLTGVIETAGSQGMISMRKALAALRAAGAVFDESPVDPDACRAADDRRGGTA